MLKELEPKTDDLHAGQRQGDDEDVRIKRGEKRKRRACTPQNWWPGIKAGTLLMSFVVTLRWGGNDDDGDQSKEAMQAVWQRWRGDESAIEWVYDGKKRDGRGDSNTV